MRKKNTSVVKMEENRCHYLQITCIYYEQASMLETLLLIQFYLHEEADARNAR